MVKEFQISLTIPEKKLGDFMALVSPFAQHGLTVKPVHSAEEPVRTVPRQRPPRDSVTGHTKSALLILDALKTGPCTIVDLEHVMVGNSYSPKTALSRVCELIRDGHVEQTGLRGDRTYMLK